MRIGLENESARLRFLREARAAASVRHPNVASVRTGENYFYAMEFVEGETPERLIRRTCESKRLPTVESPWNVRDGGDDMVATSD